MAKYLFRGSYTTAGLNGLTEEGGTARRRAAEQALASVGAGNVSGSFTISTTVLVTPEEVDEAAALGVDFRPPGN